MADLKLPSGLLEKFGPKRALTSSQHLEVFATQVKTVWNTIIRRAIKLVENAGDVMGREIYSHSELPWAAKARYLDTLIKFFLE